MGSMKLSVKEMCVSVTQGKWTQKITTVTDVLSGNGHIARPGVEGMVTIMDIVKGMHVCVCQKKAITLEHNRYVRGRRLTKRPSGHVQIAKPKTSLQRYASS